MGARARAPIRSVFIDSPISRVRQRKYLDVYQDSNDFDEEHCLCERICGGYSFGARGVRTLIDGSVEKRADDIRSAALSLAPNGIAGISWPLKVSP